MGRLLDNLKLLNSLTLTLLFSYSNKPFVHSNQIPTYITLPSSRNLFDIIFTKLNALRRYLLQTGTNRN